MDREMYKKPIAAYENTAEPAVIGWSRRRQSELPRPDVVLEVVLRGQDLIVV